MKARTMGAALALLGPWCESARGSDAGRRVNLLNYKATAGAKFDADSHIDRKGRTGGGSLRRFTPWGCDCRGVYRFRTRMANCA